VQYTSATKVIYSTPNIGYDLLTVHRGCSLGLGIIRLIYNPAV